MRGLVCGDNLESDFRSKKTKFTLTMDHDHNCPFEHRNASKLIKYMGSLIRDRTPMLFESWTNVPVPLQNDLYHDLEVSYVIIARCELSVDSINMC